jgi:hypothetical protein
MGAEARGLMKLTRSLMALTASVLVAAGGLVGTVPDARAVTTGTAFLNQASTASETDLDIGLYVIDFTADAFTVTAVTENFTPTADYSFSVYITGAQKPLADLDQYIGFTAVRSGPGSPVVYAVRGSRGEQVSSVEPTATVTYDPLTSELSLRYPLAGAFIPNSSYFSWATLSSNGASAIAGIPVIGGTAGFGPVALRALETQTSLRLSSPSQVHATKTPAVAFVRVTPVTAAGTIELLADGAVVASSPRTSNVEESSFNVPTTLASKAYDLSARFVPYDPTRYRESTSELAPFTVESAGATTKIKLTLSKRKHHWGSDDRAKLTVKLSPPKASGKVAIYDGTKKLKTLKLAKGKATYRLPSKLGQRVHEFTAKYVPKDPEKFRPSASKVVTLKVVG